MTTLFAMAAMFFATMLVTAPIVWVVTIRLTTKAEIGKLVRETGLGNVATVQLYGRAVKIVRRLHGLTELDGEMSADILSPQSKRLVDEWVRDYRKALDEGKVRAAAEDRK
jgi:hypothetical protein